MTHRMLLTCVACFLLTTGRALAYIERLYSLNEVLEESTNVVVGKVDVVDRKKRTVVATVTRPLKGEEEYRTLQFDIDAGDRRQGDFLLGLLEKGDPLVLYYERRGGEIKSIAHGGDVWFQLFANHEEDDGRVWWRFTHIEIYLGRTFNGPTKDLIQLTEEVVAGRRKGPPADPSVPAIDVRRLDMLLAALRKRRGPAPSGSASSRREIAVGKGTEWKYFKGMEEPSPESGRWREATFDDGSWTAGKAPFGYGDGPFGTELADMRKDSQRAGYASIYLRRRFDVADRKAVKALLCTVDYDDGFILWLNGKQALAVNEPEGEPAHDRCASGSHESGTYEGIRIEQPERFLLDGGNILAAQVFNQSLASSDLKFDLELEALVETRRDDGGKATGDFRPMADFEAAPGEVRGVSWVDIDGNDRLDVLFCRGGGSLLLVNEGDRFTDGTKRLGLGGGSRSGSWADYNGDDHPDLLTNDFSIYTNRGGRLRLEEKLLDAPGLRNTEGACWIDANGDGLPDVLITNGEHGIWLYENTGKGPTWFRDVSSAWGFGPKGLGKGNGDFLACADYDGDGFTDFLYNLEGGVLAHNKGGGAFQLAPKSGIDLPGGSSQKRGVAFADIDNDGDLDLFVPAGGGGRLYRNENDGKFTDITAQAGDLSSAGGASFSAAWGDVENDGDLDLFVCRTDGPGRLYLGDGRGSFKDATEAAGLEKLEPAHAASFADADDDGDLDLALNLERRVLILRNGLERAPGNGPLRVRLHVRRGLIGSVVRVIDGRSELVSMREVSGAEGCGGQGAPVVHLAVPVGTHTVSAVLSDSRVAQKKVDVGPSGAFVTLAEGEFER
ncbi:MAG TPA: VCBS repeat-containing protein [Planctomycetota bacterium]|nr:VCBS repeat-containing protein [Planctomycetota bacterium]